MKKRVLIFIFSVFLLLTFLVAGISTISSNQSREKLTQSIKSNLLKRVQALLSRFEKMLAPLEIELNSKIESAYKKLIPEVKARLKSNRGLDVQSLKKLVKNTGVDEIYLLNKSGVVAYTSFPKDLNLNLGKFGEYLKIFAEMRRVDSFFHQSSTQSTILGDFSKYSYYHIKGTEFILELGIWVKPYLEKKYSEVYRKVLLEDVFYDEIRFNPYVKDLMIKTAKSYFLVVKDKSRILMEPDFISDEKWISRDIISNRVIPRLDPDFIEMVLQKKEIVLGNKSKMEVYTYVGHRDRSEAYLSSEFILYAIYDFSEFEKTSLQSLVGMLIGIILVCGFVFLITFKFLKKYIFTKIFSINQFLQKISLGKYDDDLILQGKDELNTIAFNINRMKGHIRIREKELIETKQLLQTSLDQSPLSILIVETKTFNIIYGNNHILDIQSCLEANMIYLKTGLIDNTLYVLDYQGKRLGFEDFPLTQALRKSKVTKNLELQIKYKDKSSIWITANAAPIHNPEGQIIAAIVLCQDITEKKLSETVMIQAQKMEMVGTLSSGIAHDFNNIMGNITSSLSVLKNKIEKNIGDSQSLLKYCGNIREMSYRAIEIIKQLLAFSKKQEVSFQIVKLQDVVKNVLDFSQNSFDKRVSFELDLPEKPAYVEANPVQLEQVLLNLLINGAHAMTLMREKEEDQGGTLTLIIESYVADEVFCKSHKLKTKNYWLLKVKDSGVGMSQDVVEQIFTPFFTTKKEQGTGLGLTMIYNIIQNHHSVIEVESVPGLGSTFKVYFPQVII